MPTLTLSPRYSDDSIPLRRAAIALGWGVMRLASWSCPEDFERDEPALHGELTFDTAVAQQLGLSQGCTEAKRKMPMTTEPYTLQEPRWPSSGRHILAQFDAESIVVYQAYNPAIGHFAARHGYFGGGFGMSRMTWVKPNFLWMMYRSGWGTKENQEVTLALRLRRDAFDEILQRAVHSTFVREVYGTESTWKQALDGSDVRLQWDPDHGPEGRPLERRAIQLGLRGEILASYAKDWLLEVEDISDFVREQQANAVAPYDRLVTPAEDIYPVADVEIASRLGLSTIEDGR